MAIEEYVVGEPVLFRDKVYEDSTLTTLVDPDEITLTIKPPTGDPTTYAYSLVEVTREDVGIYAVIHVVDLEGDWHYRWESTNPDTVNQGLVTVFENNVD